MRKSWSASSCFLRFFFPRLTALCPLLSLSPPPLSSPPSSWQARIDRWRRRRQRLAAEQGRQLAHLCGRRQATRPAVRRHPAQGAPARERREEKRWRASQQADRMGGLAQKRGDRGEAPWTCRVGKADVEREMESGSARTGPRSLRSASRRMDACPK